MYYLGHQPVKYLCVQELDGEYWRQYDIAHQRTGMVVVAERVRLGDVIDALIKRHRVGITHISDTGGVSRNTIDLIRKGTTGEPGPETLRKIARGLATDPHSGDFDRPVYVDALRKMSEAAGLPDLTLDFPPCDLEAEIRSVIKDRDRASVFAAVLRRYPTMTPGQRRLVDSVLDSVGETE